MLLSILTSCKKDDSNPVTADSGLIGTWVLTSVSGSTSQGPVTITPAQANMSMTIVFNSNKTCELTVVTNGQPTNETDTWSTSNGKVTFNSNGTSYVLPYTLTGSKADIDFSSLITSINSTGGVTVTSLIFEFTKQ